MKQLKPVYSAATEQAALENLKELEDRWSKKYSLALKSWRQNWNNLAIYFKYPEEVRTVIYTTNAVESVHRQFRKVTKTRSLFPNSLPAYGWMTLLKKCCTLLTEIFQRNGRCP